jgi:hypothetical protein
MILCTNCGTRNPDDARACANCGRKLQSGWALSGGPGGGPGAANGPNGPNAQSGSVGQNGPGGPSGIGGPGGGQSAEPAWQGMEPLDRTVDENASRLMRSAAETWFYVLMLLGGALATALTENWWYVGCCLGLAAALAWARGI